MKTATILLGWLFGFAMGVSADELPVETFFREVHYRSAQISPDGNYLAVLAPAKKYEALLVVDLNTHTTSWAFGDQAADVEWFEWANTNRLIFGLSTNGVPVAGLLAINRDGTQLRRLIQVGNSWTHFLSRLPKNPDEILVRSLQYSDRDPETGFLFANVERLNLFSSHMKREVTNPGHVLAWMTDNEGVVRLGLAMEKTNYQILYRATAEAPWKVIATYGFDTEPISPVGFDADNKTLFVSNSSGEQTQGIYTYDLENLKLGQLVFRPADVDAGRPIFSVHGNLLGVHYQAEHPEVYWFSPAYKQLQDGLDKALCGTFNEIVSMSDDGRKVVVLAQSDLTPGAYYLLDTTNSKMEKIADIADWIKPEEMAEMKPIEYKSRDGLTIHGYLTVPKGSSGKNLPLIVNPHGGPRWRDTWGFDPEVQFFANRGCAVLRMNFRGSTGYGWEFEKAGFKQWGLKQQNDITDGVRWAIDQGIADPKRICIYGVSYGGYAALVGLEQTPELYRCGISYAGVTDIVRALRWSTPWWQLGRIKTQGFALVGDPSKDREELDANSPLKHAEKVQAPVMLAYGKLDPLVPIGSGKDMASALKKHGKLYDMIVKDEEGHGFRKEANRIELWKKIDVFLKATMN